MSKQATKPTTKPRSQQPQSAAARWITGTIVVGSLSVAGWFLYRSTVMPWRMANEFFDRLDHASAEQVTAAFAPDRRNTCCGQANTWLEGVRGRSGWSFARKAMSLGTTRGGKSLASVRGYIHYPDSTDERTFSITFIEMEGQWYTESFSLGPRTALR